MDTRFDPFVVEAWSREVRINQQVKAKPIKVAILVHPPIATFEIGCASELFALPRPEFKNWYEAGFFQLQSGYKLASGGLQVLAPVLEELSDIDLVVVPAWSTSLPGPELQASLLKLKNMLLPFMARGGRLVSFCSGAFLLAELGLFQGRKATTHWRYADLFKARFPDLEYVDDVLYLYDGQLGCSAGSAAALDLGLEIVRQDFGLKVANRVARRLVLAAHRQGGQAQYVETPLLKQPGRFSKTIDWALANLQKPLRVNELAQQAAMSRRSFDRVFRQSYNEAPKQWLIKQRIHWAQKLLEENDLNIEQIADKTGMVTAMSLRHHFKRQVGISPSAYRRQFGTKKASGPSREF